MEKYVGFTVRPTGRVPIHLDLNLISQAIARGIVMGQAKLDKQKIDKDYSAKRQFEAKGEVEAFTNWERENS